MSYIIEPYTCYLAIHVFFFFFGGNKIPVAECIVR